MDPEQIENEIEKLIDRAQSLSDEPTPDPLELDRVALELTAYLSYANDLHRRYEFRANTWKGRCNSITEVVRSLRRLHETVNLERRNP